MRNKDKSSTFALGPTKDQPETTLPLQERKKL
jgi:hypothetical protein